MTTNNTTNTDHSLMLQRCEALGLETLDDSIRYALARGQWLSDFFRVLENGTDAEVEAFANLPITDTRPEGWPFAD